MNWMAGWLENKGPSWRQRLNRVREDLRTAEKIAAPRISDPWEVPLADLKGEVHDAYERLPTYVAFDHLGIRHAERTSGAARRLARAMRELGWHAIRYRIRRGSCQRVRGFQRVMQLSVSTPSQEEMQIEKN